MTQSSKHRIPFKPQRRGSSAHLTGFSSRQGSRFIYSYDSWGRMLTRDDGVDVTKFTWSGWDCVKEVTGESETVYHIPEGQILSFIRDGETYQVHSDCLGSVRLVTDDNGEVVLRKDYDAWGSELTGGFDNISDGMPYGFLGSMGLREDALTGLTYIRKRWYNPGIQRFISRDQRLVLNRYNYASNRPTTRWDINGMESEKPKGWFPGKTGPSQETLDKIRSQVMARTNTKRCKDALKKLRDNLNASICPTSETDTGEQIWDKLFNKLDIEFKTGMDLPIDRAKFFGNTIDLKGEKWELAIGWDKSYGDLSNINEEILETTFHELLHVVGAEHGPRRLFEDVLMPVVATECGFPEGLASNGYPGRDIFNRLKAGKGMPEDEDMKTRVNQLFEGYFK